MFTQSQTLAYYSPRNMLIWLTMTFQAGAINAGAFMACRKFVTHTTGVATNIATEMAEGRWLSGAGFAMLPLFYMAGAMTSAYFVDYRIQSGRRPLYPVVMGLAFLLLAQVWWMGSSGRYGAFDADFDILHHLSLLVSLAFTSGLLNGTVTSASGAVIRITHMTGLTTDLGIGLVRVLTRSHHLNSRRNEIHANLFRAAIFLFFVLGGFVSTLIYLRVGYRGFLLPCLLALLLFAWSGVRFVKSKPSPEHTAKAAAG